MIWFNMLIPIIAVIVLAVGFKKKMAFWEYALVFLIPILGIAIAKYTSVYSQTRATEYWNSYLVQAEYIEPWSTWVKKTCERCHEECTGSGEDRTCHQECESYDCSYCDDNGPSWIAWDNLGRSYRISQDYFERLCRIWVKRQFVELNRHINYHNGFMSSCGQDGDKYVTSFDKVFEHTQPVVTAHSYENRVRSSKSIFNFQKVDPKDISTYGLVDYRPADLFGYNPIFGAVNDSASKRLAWWNAQLGSVKQVHMNIIVFHNKTIRSAEMQRSYWKGGNKNEFILCIGVDSNNKIQWTKVISWTEIEILKLRVERSVASMDFNLPTIVDTMAINVRKDFKRKEFKDFKYISVEPTPFATVMAFVVTLILTVGISIFSIMNEFNVDGVEGDSTRNFYRRKIK